jgi:acyl carrier protein
MEREVLRKTLLDILAQESWISGENLTDDVNLRTDLKLDSVDLLSMAFHAERTLGVSIDSQDFENVNTLGDLLDLLQAKLSAKPAVAAA